MNHKRIIGIAAIPAPPHGTGQIAGYGEVLAGTPAADYIEIRQLVFIYFCNISKV